jgi:hypothetical protein
VTARNNQPSNAEGDFTGFFKKNDPAGRCKWDEKGYAVARQTHTDENSEFWPPYLVTNSVHHASLLGNFSKRTTAFWREIC